MKENLYRKIWLEFILQVVDKLFYKPVSLQLTQAGADLGNVMNEKEELTVRESRKSKIIILILGYFIWPLFFESLFEGAYALRVLGFIVLAPYSWALLHVFATLIFNPRYYRFTADGIYGVRRDWRWREERWFAPWDDVTSISWTSNWTSRSGQGSYVDIRTWQEDSEWDRITKIDSYQFFLNTKNLYKQVLAMYEKYRTQEDTEPASEDDQRVG